MTEPSAEAPLSELINNFYMDGDIQEWLAVRLHDAVKTDRAAAYRRGIEDAKQSMLEMCGILGYHPNSAMTAAVKERLDALAPPQEGSSPNPAGLNREQRRVLNEQKS
jgi:hypothetical protein